MSQKDSIPLSVGDAASWRFPRDPQIAPDGSRIAFTLVAVAQPGEHGQSSIWTVDVPSRHCRQFTYGRYEDKYPRWSPDGTRLAFVSDRSEGGKFRLYVMPTDGGEATQVLTPDGNISDPRWSPDGKWLAFIAVDPETADDKQRNEDRRDEIVADTRHKYGRLYVSPLNGGDARCVASPENMHLTGYSWGPDSVHLVVQTVTAPRADEESYGPTTLSVSSVHDDEGHRVLLLLDTGLEQVRWSPDGQTIAYRSKAGRVQASDAVWALPAKGGEPVCLTLGYSGSVIDMVWSPDSQEIRFIGEEDLSVVLRSIDIQTCKIRHAIPESMQPVGSFEAGMSVSSDGTRFAVVRSFSHEPPNVWTGVFGESVHRITWLNESIATRSFASAERISWQSTDGWNISGLLYRPLNFQEGQRYPLVVHIHGGPAWLWSDRFMGDWHDWAQLLAGQGFVVLLPNPRGSTGRGTTFLDANVNDLGGMELADMVSGVDYVLRLGIVDKDRMGVGGWSHGGYMTAWTITQTDRFRAAVMGAGIANLISDQGENDIPGFNREYWDRSVYDDPAPYWDRSPLKHVSRVKTPLLIVHGGKDERCTQPQAQEMYRGVKHQGVETEFVTYPREGHHIKERAHQVDLMERVLGWYNRHLK